MNTTQAESVEVELTWAEMVDTFQYNTIYDMGRMSLSPEEMVRELRATADALQEIIKPDDNGMEAAWFMITTGYAKDLIPKDLLSAIREYKMDLHIVGDQFKSLMRIPHDKIK